MIYFRRLKRLSLFEDFKDVPDWQYEVNVYLGYFYFLSKIVDFSDTFFFVLVSSLLISTQKKAAF